MSSSSAGDGKGGWPPPGFDERAIDGRLLSQLIARHGAPRKARPLTFAEQERRTLIARRERATAAADPALVHHVERHERDADDFRRTPAPISTERASIARFDLDAWRIRLPGPVGEERQLEPSDEVMRALEQRTPQAFLRDLHRPVQEFGDVQLRRVPSPSAVGPALARIRAAIASAMAHRSRDDATQPLATRLMNAGMEELRTILARPWAESRPENPLPLSSTMPDIRDHMWFGLSGGYDPDV